MPVSRPFIVLVNRDPDRVVKIADGLAGAFAKTIACANAHRWQVVSGLGKDKMQLVGKLVPDLTLCNTRVA